MGTTRLTNLALGPYANFYVNSSNVFTESDATPDVTNGILFFTNNTSNTTITDFDLTGKAAIPGGTAVGSIAHNFEGKEIQVVFLDDSTRLASSARLKLAGTDGLQGSDNVIGLIYHNSSWIEQFRSYAASNVATVTSANLGATGIASVLGQGPISVLQILADTASPSTLRRVTYGEQGQILHVVANGVSNALVIVNSAANDTFVVNTSASSTQITIASTSAVAFVRVGPKWIELKQAVQ